MGIDQPVALRLDTHVTGFGLRIQEEAVVSHDDRLVEPLSTELVQRHANEFQRPRNQA